MIQRNAIRSWTHLGAQVDVLMMGNEEGMADVARDFEIRYFPEVECSELGTPYISSMIELARQSSEAPYLAILNADILLMQDFVEAAQNVGAQVQEFLFLGRRWDLDVEEELNFEPNWEVRLRQSIEQRGVLHGPVGSDYFLFPRDLFRDMPDFTIGRSGWDNWTIYHAVQSGLKVVDVTRSTITITAICLEATRPMIYLRQKRTSPSQAG
jgi:hypothetical protein